MQCFNSVQASSSSDFSPAWIGNVEDVNVAQLIRSMEHSVTLADPLVEDCPLIGCSEGFEVLTGYRRSEIIGQNCRFLNEGCPIDPNMRATMRLAVRNGDEFVGIILNRKKTGEWFRNLLHMVTVRVRGKPYVIAVQGDVTDIPLDLTNVSHVRVLKEVANMIFLARIDSWVQRQVSEYYFRRPLNSEVQAPSLMLGDQAAVAKNTFLHFNEGATNSAFFRRCTSDSGVPRTTKDILDAWGLPVNLDPAPEIPDFSDDEEDDFPPSPTKLLRPVQPTPPQCQAGVLDSGYAKRVPQPLPMGLFEGQESRKQQPLPIGLFEAGRMSPLHIANSSTSREISEPSQMTGGSKVPLSIGSKAHPDNCNECQFHFFSATGCRMGADCRYCHEFHPRKCQKKNRRILKRLGDAPAPDSSPTNTPLETEADPVVKSLRYLKEAYVDKARPPRATFLVGQKVRLQPWIVLDETKGQGLVQCFSFSVEPPLPDGLSLHPNTGVISGFARTARVRDLYMVTLSAPATGPLGLELGSVALAKCSISLRVADTKPMLNAALSVQDLKAGG